MYQEVILTAILSLILYAMIITRCRPLERVSVVDTTVRPYNLRSAGSGATCSAGTVPDKVA